MPRAAQAGMLHSCTPRRNKPQHALPPAPAFSSDGQKRSRMTSASFRAHDDDASLHAAYCLPGACLKHAQSSPAAAAATSHKSMQCPLAEPSTLRSPSAAAAAHSTQLPAQEPQSRSRAPVGSCRVRDR
ncbi:hypothetical protein IQ07DRAFT_181647 [Pyrenochaeta sp. DS3sAY3a]|nr:hypothetical protein IQ07DRAFT_181647 [Pyrenochaeta sp. DS3sAY3a]